MRLHACALERLSWTAPSEWADMPGPSLSSIQAHDCSALTATKPRFRVQLNISADLEIVPLSVTTGSRTGWLPAALWDMSA